MSLTKRIIICFIALLCAAVHSVAQNQGKFYGIIGATGSTSLKKDEGFDRLSRQSGEASMKLGFATHNFDVQFNASGRGSYKTNNKVGITFNTNEGRERFDLDATVEERKEASFNFGLSSTYTPNKANRIKIDFSQSFSKEDPTSMITTLSLLGDGLLTFSSEEGSHRKESSSVGADYLHLFDKKGRQLEARVDISHTKTDKITIWEKGNGIMSMDENREMATEFDYDEENYRKYRLTPFNVSETYIFDGRFTEPEFAGINRLKMTFSLIGQVRHEGDEYMAANWTETEWVDSLRYRESFNYISMTIDPCIKAEWSIGQFAFVSELTPEYYTDRLNDASHSGKFHADRISPLIFFQTTYSPGGGHTLKCNLRRSVTRPEYLQKCWFQRQGSYADELYEGNTNLRPSSSNRFSLGYTFSKGRFISELEAVHTYVSDKIEKTFRTETLNDIDWRIYTWINAGYSNTSTARLTLKWNATRLKADISANYNYFIGVVKSGKETRNSDYNISGNVSYNFPKPGITIQAKGKYQSKIIRSYSSMTEYVGCDARVEKKFKHFNLFLEGKDLFDKSISVNTISEDQTQGRDEVYNYNRRMFLLGANYNF